ncbi:MAG: BglG family transcription antiterminator [Firmicutes bacterium]|nr:BglG family transcription antiterminator [Bacillota bacterium]
MLSQRCLHILKVLVDEDSVTIKELGDRLKISSRTVRYDLDKIDDWLAKNKIPLIQREYGKGIKLDKIIKSSPVLTNQLSELTAYEYIFSPEERVEFILIELLEREKPITVDDIARMLLVSRNTVRKDLNEAEKWLKKRQLSLVKKQNTGVYIEGTEIKKRRAVLDMLAENINTNEMLKWLKQQNNPKSRIDKSTSLRLYRLFNSIDLGTIEKIVMDAEAKLNRSFADNAYIGLITHIAIAIKRLQLNKDIVMPEEELNRLENTFEYTVATSMAQRLKEEFGIPIPKAEIGYITLHLLSNKMQSVNVLSEMSKTRVGDNAVLDCVNSMITFMEEQYNVSFADCPNLVKDLYVHLRPAVYRLKYGMKLTNPLLNEIKENYKDVFINTLKASRVISKRFGIKVLEDEIAYLAMHFGAALERIKKKSYSPVQVIVVCSSGIGTAKILAARLESLYSNVEVIDTLSYNGLLKADKDKLKGDLILTTISIDNPPIPAIEVNPFLELEDQEKLSRYFSPKTGINRAVSCAEVLLKEIMAAVKKHCKIEDEINLQNELLFLLKRQFSNNIGPRNIDKGVNIPLLNDLITEETISLKVKAGNWKEAIKKGVEPLEKLDIVKKSYSDKIIKAVEEIGPYFVLAPGIAISHARPEDGVNRIGMSLITLDPGVDFGNEENDPVRLLITLAAVDNETHLKALSQLMTLLNNRDEIQRILESRDKRKVLEIIKKIPDTEID